MADYIPYASIALLIFQGFTIKYLLDLEKNGCYCAMDWKRNFIIIYTLFAIAVTILTIFFKKSLGPALNVLFTVFTVVNTILSIIYIYNLKITECRCSEHIMRELIHYTEIFKGIMWIVSAIMLLYFIYALKDYGEKISKTLSSRLTELKDAVGPQVRKTIKKVVSSRFQ